MFLSIFASMSKHKIVSVSNEKHLLAEVPIASMSIFYNSIPCELAATLFFVRLPLVG